MTVMLVGLVVIPILPGLVIIWAAALGYGLALPDIVRLDGSSLPS